MPVQFRRRIKVAPGVYVNLSKSGPSLTIGPRGLRYNVGPRGQYVTAGLPGTGLYLREKIGGKPADKTAGASIEKADLVRSDAADNLTERTFVEGLTAYFSGEYQAALNQFQQLEKRGDHLPDVLLMAGLCCYLLVQPQKAIDYLLGCLDRVDGEVPVPGHTESLTTRLINPAARFNVPVTRFTVAELPYSVVLAVFLVIELIQIYGELDNALEVAEPFADNIPTSSRRLMELSLAELYTAAKQFDKLESLFVDQIGQLDNEDNISVELMLYWAGVLTVKEQYEAAKDVYVRALRKKADRDPELLKVVQYARADMFESWGKRADARTYFEKLYALDPSFANVQERIKSLE